MTNPDHVVWRSKNFVERVQFTKNDQTMQEIVIFKSPSIMKALVCSLSSAKGLTIIQPAIIILAVLGFK